MSDEAVTTDTDGAVRTITLDRPAAGNALGIETLESFDLSLCFSTDDQVEGMEAFLEEREPEYTDTIG
jgi:enoyl-CoA hydratase/carnithine racemase